MSENTEIEWADHTFNPWEGCQKTGSLACQNCYAETRNARFGAGVALNWGPGAPRRRTSEANWKKPLKWEREAAAFFAEHGRRQRVFCASLADVYDNAVDPQWRADLFDLIDATPSLDWLLLTKRVGNVMKMVRETGRERLPRNVWQGATIVTQSEALRDIPKLVEIDASVLFLSMEPLMELVTIGRWLDRIGWVIVGGESGPRARPMAPAWARYLRRQCDTHQVPFLFKQWGEWAPGLVKGTRWAANWSFDGGHWSFFNQRPRNFMISGADAVMTRVGKKAAGRMLDGCTYDEFPNMEATNANS